MRSITFIISGAPIPLARVRVGRHSIYDSQKHQKFVSAMELIHQMGHHKILTGPLIMDVTFFMPLNKAKRRAGTPHWIRPDLDNLIKYVCDVCNDAKSIYHDDCCIWKITASKVYSDKPRTVFTLTESNTVGEDNEHTDRQRN